MYNSLIESELGEVWEDDSSANGLIIVSDWEQDKTGLLRIILGWSSGANMANGSICIWSSKWVGSGEEVLWDSEYELELDAKRINSFGREGCSLSESKSSNSGLDSELAVSGVSGLRETFFEDFFPGLREGGNIHSLGRPILHRPQIGLFSSHLMVNKNGHASVTFIRRFLQV